MNLGNATITATTGPGLTVTAQPFIGIESIEFDFHAGCLYLKSEGATHQEFDLNGVTAVTVVIANKTYSFTIS